MKKQSLFKKPFFWFSATCISLFCLGLAYHYFPQAIPLVSVDITMDRAQALQAAKTLATKNNWGPEKYQQATSFNSDNLTQYFIELDGGGKERLTKIIEEKFYTPYTWHVRHFQQQEANETHIYFAPDGTPFGFHEIIPEDQLGAALQKNQAQKIAETTAEKTWNIDFKDYTLVEHSQEKRPSNRIDHTFEYNHKTKKVGEAPYRLKLTVSGDTLTELTLFIKIPEGFKRRFSHMRSANNTLAQGANILMFLLYVLGGCIFGLIFLLKKRWVLFKPSFFMALFIALLQVLNSINQFPLRWMYYDTAFSKQTFILNFIVGIFTQLIMYTGLFFLIISAAESLTRKAFGHQGQLWKSWSPSSASSWQVLGKTIGGYLIIGFDMVFIVLLYTLTMKYFGWWMPSGNLIEPNILATYMPWFSSLAQSLQAGFIEECLFRAVPLACAALLGNKYGNKKWWLIGAFILQAIIFGAAHANYPAQPFYARLVELIIPSFVFGGLYLAFGLLPGIISHFVYDVFWFSLPLFVSEADGIWWQRILVIIGISIPLAIVLRARYRKGRWQNMPKNNYNDAWEPPKKIDPRKDVEDMFGKIVKQTKHTKQIVLTMGLIGLIAWLTTTPFTHDSWSLMLTRSEAITQSKKLLEKNNINLQKPWQILSNIHATSNQPPHYFIWQKGGKNNYKTLLDNLYLAPPRWHIRNAQFEGDIEKRAEEYQFSIADNNTILQQQHILPESEKGQSLSKQQAFTLVQKALEKYFNKKTTELVEVSAISKKRPHRLDWIFTFKDEKIYPLNEGEARIVIQVSGNEVTNYYRYIHAPEEWQRDFKDKQKLYATLKMFCLMILILGFLLISLLLFLRYKTHQISKKIFMVTVSFFALQSIIQLMNSWQNIIAVFRTSEPYTNQLFSVFGSFGVSLIYKSLFFAFLASYFSNIQYRFKAQHTPLMRLILGISLGTLFSGTTAFLHFFGPSLKPLWPIFSHASAYVPVLSFATQTISSFVLSTIAMLIIFSACDVFTQGWKTNKGYLTLSLIIAGIALSGTIGIEHFSFWIINGIVFGILLLIAYVFAIRLDRSIIPYLTMTTLAFSCIQQTAFNAYPGVLFGTIVSLIGLGFYAHWWSNQLK